MARFAAKILIVCVAALWPNSLLVMASESSDEVEFFESRIRPVLFEHCYQCHSKKSDKLQGGLLLDSGDGILQGGDSGSVVQPGAPYASLLLSALRYDDLEMPPKGKLPDKVIADFQRWIELGAPVPIADAVPSDSNAEIDFDEARSFWAFQPPRPRPVPDVGETVWPLRKHDWFVLDQIRQAGIQPNGPASRRQLIRRLSLDLIGIPPSPRHVHQFLDDTSPSAYENVVDRLLASPHFGERWARMWLDLARYAEDQAHIVGNNQSLFYPNAYLYRDWVIGALNGDVAYDQFVQQQLAADLISPDDHDSHVALGFLGLGPKYYNRGRIEVKADEWEDRVDVVTRGLLGLTVACARCHDHKYDPIPTEDYYALAGVFASTEMFNRPLDRAKGNGKGQGQAKKPLEAMHIVREGKATDLNVFIRGNVENKGPVVDRHYLTVLCSDESERFQQGSGRHELARLITDPRNPLSARVLVNRIWGRLIGKPIVATPSNFGTLGDRPTHPSLLDDLAYRFMRQGWSVKWLVREIVLSATYRQTGHATAEQISVDPTNRLLSRMNRRRLDVEAWRDSLLSVCDRLDTTIGGKSVDPQQPDSARRTVYAKISRFKLNPMLSLFDFPDANVHSAKRTETTTPLQKLFMMNHPFVSKQAEALASLLLRQSLSDDRTRIQWLYQRLFSRDATDDETQLGIEYMRRATESSRPAAWRDYSQVLLTSNEMMFVD